MLRGCVVLLLREQQQQQQQQQQDDDERPLRMLRTLVEAAGGVLSINGIPALDARTLTHVVAAGWETTVALAPSLAAQHSGKFADYAQPGSPPKFVTERWLDDSLTAGKLLAEAEFEFAAAVAIDSGVVREQKRRKVQLGGWTEVPAAPEYTSTATSWHSEDVNRPENSQQSYASAEETDVDDYEVKEEHSREAEDPAAAVITQVSFKQGEFTRDHEWMRELEECIDQGLHPPNHDRVVKLMQMAKICDVAMDECNPTRDKYRAKALKLAALKLRGHGERLKTEQDVRALLAPVRGVGPKTTLKVIELVKTGTLRRLDDRLADPKTNAVRSLCCLGIAYLTGLCRLFCLYDVTILTSRWLGCLWLRSVRSFSSLGSLALARLQPRISGMVAIQETANKFGRWTISEIQATQRSLMRPSCGG